MKATLYKLKQGYVLCSDEQPNHDYKGLMLFTPAMRLLNDMGVSLMGDFKKVLTQSPDFSELSEEDAKSVGIYYQPVVEAIDRAWSYLNALGYFIISNEGRVVENLLIQARIRSRELTADRRFTEDDMRKCYQWAVDNVDADGCLIDDEEVDFKDFIQSLAQPKSWEVEYKEENGVYKVTKIL